MGSPGTLLALDSASLYYRAFFAMPSSMTAPDGRPNGAIRGFLSTLSRLVRRFEPTMVVAAWDEDWRPAWRVSLVPSYKAHRVLVDPSTGDADPSSREAEPDGLAAQEEAIAGILDSVGIPRWGIAEHEADDVLGSLAAQQRVWAGSCVVVSGDRDLVQLIDARTRLLLTVNGGMEKWPLLDASLAAERFGVAPEHYADLAALRGDPSDGLPGVPGVGAKTATRLVEAFGSIEDILAVAPHPRPPLTPRIAERLISGAEELRRARAVTGVVRDLPLPPLPATLTDAPGDPQRLEALVREWGVAAQAGELQAALNS